MLFMYRPPQTYMPYRLPRNRMQQAQYNREMQDKFNATRRAAAPAPSAAPDPIEQLREIAKLHDAGALSDDEFAAAKAKLLAAS